MPKLSVEQKSENAGIPVRKGTGIPAVPPFLTAKAAVASFSVNAVIRRSFLRIAPKPVHPAARNLAPPGSSLKGALRLLIFFIA